MLRIITLLLILISSVSYGAETVYTWGYGDILAHMIHGVKLLFASDDYIGLFKIFLTIGLILILLSYLGNKNQDPLQLLKFYIISIGLWYMFVSPVVFRTDVYIDDKTNNNYDQVVTDVPYVYAKILSWFSRFEYTTARIMELAFSIPDSLRYSESGFLTAFGLISNANSHKIIDTHLYLSVNDYINNCIFPDIVDGSKDVYTLATSSNLWADLGGTSGARTTKYYDSSNPNGVLKTCPDAYASITSVLDTYITTTGLPFLSKMIGSYSASVIDTVLGTASKHYLDYAVTGQAYLRQTISMNMFSEAFQNFARVNGINSYGLAVGAAKAEETARNNMALSGVLSAKYIPIIKGVLTAIAAGLIPILVLLLLTPMFKRVLIGIFMIFGWLSLWHISEVLLNAIIDVKASHFLRVAADGSLNLLNRGIVDSTVLDYINMVSSFYWAIPAISFLIASGFSIYAMSQMSGQMAAKAQTTGGPASEMATGSINTASSLTTGRRWDFSSFQSGGYTASYAMKWNESFGSSIESQNVKKGVLGDIDVGKVQNMPLDIAKVIGHQAPRLAKTIEKALGERGNGALKAKGGTWGDLSITDSNLRKNIDGTYSGVVKGVANNGSEWTFYIDRNRVTKATGDKNNITYTFYKDKDGNDRVDVKAGENMALSAIKTENGWRVQTATGPIDVNFVNRLQKILNGEKSVLDQLKTTDGVLNGFKKGDSSTKLSMLNYVFGFLTKDTNTSSNSRIFAYNILKAVGEEVIENLGQSVVKDINQGKRIDKGDEIRAVLSGGVGLSLGSVSLLRKFNLGSNNKTLEGKAGIDADGTISAKIDKAWLYKDSLYVQTSDGLMYKYNLSSQAKEAIAEGFSLEVTTNFTENSAYEELKSAGITNKEQYQHAKEDFYQRLAEIAMLRSEQINNSIRKIENNESGISDNLMRFVIEDYANRHNMSYLEAFRELNQNPNKIFKEYFENPERLDELINKVYGGNVSFSDVKHNTQKAENKVNEVNYDKIEKFKYNNTPSVDDLNKPMKDVSYNPYNEKDAKKKADEKGITPEQGRKSVEEPTVMIVNKNLNYPNKSLSQLEEEVKEKELNKKKVEQTWNEFFDMLDNYNSKSGSHYQYTLEDFRNGKVDKTLEALKKEITKMEQIPGYLESKQRNNLYNNFKQQYKDLTELKNKYDEAVNITLAWNMYSSLKNGRGNLIANPEVRDGSLFGNDPSAVDKTTGKPIFEK